MEIAIAVFTGITVFLLILLIATLLSKENIILINKEKLTVDHVCNRIIKTEPEVLADKLGIQTDKYMFNCNCCYIICLSYSNPFFRIIMKFIHKEYKFFCINII